MKLIVALSVLCWLAFSGCARSAVEYSVRFTSKSGDELAAGTIRLSEVLPVNGKVRGQYRLAIRRVSHRDKAVDWFFRLFEQKETGEVEWRIGLAEEGEPHQLDFMPDMADGNILIGAAPSKDGVIRGNWIYAIAAGGWEGGAAELRKK